MTVSFCKHRFPIQPPHGSLARPGNCRHCDATWNDIQAELAQQENALLIGSSHDGTCPDCHQPRRLFRYQPEDQPWHEIGDEQPVTFLCSDCRNSSIDAEHAFVSALMDAI